MIPEVPKLVLTEASGKWLKVTWDAVKSDKFYYKLTVKKGEEDFFSEKVNNVPFKLEGLKEGEIYTAYLFVCYTETSKCKSTSKGMELQTVAPTAGSSGKVCLTCTYVLMQLKIWAQFSLDAE